MKIIKKHRAQKAKYPITPILMGLFVAGILMYLIMRVTIFLPRGLSASPSLSCGTKSETRTVAGDSLSGFLSAGSDVKVFFNYYDCQPIARGDLVMYSYVGRADPIIKIAHGIPGDTFGFKKAQDGWRLLINGLALKNSLGEFYTLDDRAYRLLSLYEHDDHGIIPANTYLILGNLANGSIDSTRFGLVDKSDILGKAVPATE